MYKTRKIVYERILTELFRDRILELRDGLHFRNSESARRELHFTRGAFNYFISSSEKNIDSCKILEGNEIGLINE